MSQYSAIGTLMQGSGGLYAVKIDRCDTPLSGVTVHTRARGNMRRDGLLVGDRVCIEYSDSSFTLTDGKITPCNDSAGLPECAICSVLERKNELIRPAMANLDTLFIVCAAAKPDPDPLTVDKLISVCEYYGIAPVIVIGKEDLDTDNAKRLEDIYKKVGYPVFRLSCMQNTGILPLQEFIKENCAGKISAFSGASGVGKSTLMSRIFPELGLETGEISKKNGRGKHTTRRIDLFTVNVGENEALIADTPGFTCIDFENFDFLPFEALPSTMKDFLPFYKNCRYLDCSHTREQECGVAQALREGKISESRHESFISMYETLRRKEKNKYS